MDIRSLIQFLTIEEEGSYTKAAQKLFLTQPTLTKTIQNLEQELGVQLFQKNGQHLELTEFGVELKNSALPLVNEFRCIPQRVKSVKEKNTGAVAISTTPMLAGLYLVKFMPAFCENYPLVKLKVVEGGTYDVIDAVLKNEVDVGLCMYTDSLTKFPELEIYPVLSDDIVAVTHENYPLAEKKTIRMEDLRHEKINSYAAGHAVQEEIVRRCTEQGFLPMVNFSSDNTNFLVELSRAGNGITILPKPFLTVSNCSKLRVLSFDPPFPWRCNMILKKNRYHTHVVNSFVAYTLEAFKKLDQETSLICLP